MSGIQKKKRIITPEDLLPKTVENTRGELMPFDAIRIVDSLVKETGLPRKKAMEVTRSVLKRISSLGLDFIAAPHIRELVCGELTARGLHEYRNRYTRLGLPIYDVKSLLHGTSPHISSSAFKGPHFSYNWIAGQVIEQYVHLDQLTQDIRELHLKGIVHIDFLNFWDEIITQHWDLRTILMFGIPPIKWSDIARSTPAQNALTAVSHAAKWFQIVHGEFSGTQGYDNFTVFIAPYLRDLEYKTEDPNKIDIVQVAQSFIFETNQLFGSSMGGPMEIFIGCVPSIPEELKNVDAIGPGGKIVGKYGDYEKECRLFFHALAEVYSHGDAEGNPIMWPRFVVKVTKNAIESCREEYLFALKNVALKMGNCSFLNAMEEDFSYVFSPQVSLPLNEYPYFPHTFPKLSKDKVDPSRTLNNFGILQNINLNLIRLSYLAKTNNTTLKEELGKILPVVEDALITKYNLIKKELNAKHSKLPFAAAHLEKNPLNAETLIELDKQFLSISLTGIAKISSILIGKEFLSDEGIALISDIIEYLQTWLLEASKKHGISFLLTAIGTEHVSDKFIQRDKRYMDPEFYNRLDLERKDYVMGVNLFLPKEKIAEHPELLKSLGTLHSRLFHGCLLRINFEDVPKDEEKCLDLILSYFGSYKIRGIQVNL